MSQNNNDEVVEPEKAVGPISPKSIILVFYLVAVFLCLAVLGLHLFANWSESKLAVLPESRVAVGTSDMLGIEITLSGISIPLAITYLLTKSKELHINIYDQTVYNLRKNNIGPDEISQAQAVYDDLSNALVASKTFLAVQEVMRISPNEAFEIISDNCLRWIISIPYYRAGYKQLFAKGQDRALVLSCVKIVAIPAFILLIDLYVRFLGCRGWYIDAFELLVLVFCGCANLLTYSILIHIARVKSGLREQAREDIPKACDVCSNEIKTALMYIRTVAELVKSQMSASESQFDKALSGGATGPEAPIP